MAVIVAVVPSHNGACVRIIKNATYEENLERHFPRTYQKQTFYEQTNKIHPSQGSSGCLLLRNHQNLWPAHIVSPNMIYFVQCAKYIRS